MSVFTKYHDLVGAQVKKIAPDANPSFVVEPPRDHAHGDLATNVAMVMCKMLQMKPRDLAEKLKPLLEAMTGVASVEIAGPGFINLRLMPDVWQNEVRHILREGKEYGDSDIGKGQKVNVEYVSANPTGPMHAGHVRGAVVGDALCNLLIKAGFDVTREYYFNDAGEQVDVLARTTYLRYREALGEDIGAIPEGLYPGEYLKDVAGALVARDGNKWQGKDEAQWMNPIRAFAVEYMVRMIREDLALIGVRHDVFTNEREIVENGTLDTAFKILEDKGLIYVGTLPPPKGKEIEGWEPAELTLFRSSQFGDNTDRPLKNRQGRWTYLMPDIAYHYDKMRRGYKVMINVLGTDHGGYLERMRPAIAGFDATAKLNVIFNNIVKVFKNGEPVKLSKRSGNLITLREMVEQVGADPVRFFMLTRTPDSPLDFDFAKVVEQTRDNPNFYVQYAHARCCSVIRRALDEGVVSAQELKSGEAKLNLISTPEEILLIKYLSSFVRVIESAAEANEPHRMAFYLIELAGHFHGFWNKGNDNANLRFIIAGDKDLTLARLALIQAVQIVLANGLKMLGCTPLEELRDDRSNAE